MREAITRMTLDRAAGTADVTFNPAAGRRFLAENR